MIEINLIPPELRKKKKSRIGNMGIPFEVLVGSLGGLIVLLVLTHIFFLWMNINKLSEHKSLEKEWDLIVPAKKNVDDVITELRSLQDKQKSVVDVIQKGWVVWAQKLNILSDHLPRGVWLRRVSFSGVLLSIEGSAISRKKKEMINVHEFMANLKKEEGFLNQLEDLELGSMHRRYIKKIEIADFVITTKVK